MWYIIRNRSILLELIHKKDVLDDIDIFNSNSLYYRHIASDNIVLVWDNKPNENTLLPNLIIIPNGTSRDFFAWTLTYLQALSPLTSYCRVIELSELEIWDNLNYVDKIANTIEFDKRMSVVIGSIIGEAHTLKFKRNNSEIINFKDSINTLSYYIGKLLILNQNIEAFENIIRSFSKLYKILGFTEYQYDKDLYNYWKILFTLNNNYSLNLYSNFDNNLLTLQEVSNEIYNYGIINKKYWSKLTNNLIPYPNNLFKSESYRESKVKELQTVIIEFKNYTALDRNISSFVLAYFASQIAPGSLLYVDLLKPLIIQHPSILLWYGFCEGIYGINTLQLYRNGLGLKIAKELNLTNSNSILSIPTCDVQLKELDVLINSNINDDTFLDNSVSSSNIEIFPTINYRINQNMLINSNKLKKISIRENIDPISELGIKLKELQNIYNKINTSKYKKNKIQ